MDDINELEVQIKDLKNAYDNVISAMNNLNEAIDGLDEQYKQLEQIAEDINDERIDLEIALERLEEEAYYDENEQLWRKERQEEERQYWNTQF